MRSIKRNDFRMLSTSLKRSALADGLNMVLSREKHSDGSASVLMVLKTDSEPTAALINRLKARPNIVRVKTLTLPPRNA